MVTGPCIAVLVFEGRCLLYHCQFVTCVLYIHMHTCIHIHCSYYANVFIDTCTSQPGQRHWYFELHINAFSEPSHSATSAAPPPSPSSTVLQPHLRVGWADFQLFSPHPISNGRRTTSGGVGDDFASVGFDGKEVWLGGHSFRSSSPKKIGRLHKQVSCQLTHHS